MDSHIRSLLLLVQRGHDVQKNTLAAFELLKQHKASLSSISDNLPAFSHDLYVICAELAFQNGDKEMAAKCLKMFFEKSCPPNQFLCRAYLCQAQITAPTTADVDQFEKAIVYLLKAVSFARENPRYHFLVYNGSVLYWSFCRPFLKAGFKQHLARSMQQVVKALDETDDKDYEWRAMFMISLIQCHLDGGRVSEASQVANLALSFVRQNVPSKFKELFGLAMRKQLVDPAKLQKDIRSSAELAVYYRLCKLQVAMEQKDANVNFSDECQKILNSLSKGEIQDSLLAADTAAPTGPGGKKSNKSIRPVTPASPPPGGKEEGRKSPLKGRSSSNMVVPTASKKMLADSPDKPYMTLELARICLDLGFYDMATSCVDQMRNNCNVKDKGFFLEVEFTECSLMVKSLGDKQDGYQSGVVQRRQQAIKKCEEALLNAIRNGDPNIVQLGCVTQWNLCLPLLQSGLRRTVRRPLQVVASALEDIESLLVLLRCQVHTELAKCDEDEEQVESALLNYQKALALDDGGIYRDRLDVSICRAELRRTLYEQPQRPEDMAAMIIEQARTSDSGSIRMKRSLLIRVGLALAPDVFDIALDSENDAKATINADKSQEGMIKQLNARAKLYRKCISKVPGHLERLGSENDVERCRLWADLARIARKQLVWDVCRVACKFCLLYDDGRWKMPAEKKPRTPGMPTGESSDNAEKKSSRPATPAAQPVPNLLEADTLRLLAEVHFINAEALLHLLRSENVELNDKPVPPVDGSKRPKGYVPKKLDDMPDWKEYCDWITSLNQEVISSFLRAVTFGRELGEAWLIVNAATYFWNYSTHIIKGGRHREVIAELQTILDGMKKVGHDGSTVLLIQLCVALAQGYIQPWLPPPRPKEPILPRAMQAQNAVEGDDSSRSSPRNRKAGATGATSVPKSKYQAFINPEGVPDAKRALEVIEYAMRTTNGSNPSDVVPISVRDPMLRMWVLIKQLLQAQITKHLGTEDEGSYYVVAETFGTSNEGQNLMTRAQVAVEMLYSNLNGIFEFRDGPTLNEAADMVEACAWSDRLVELQIWTRLASYARSVHDHAIVMKCTGKVLDYAYAAQERAVLVTAAGSKRKSAPAAATESIRYLTEQRMYALASCMMGESLIENMRGQNSIRRQAMQAFQQSAEFGRNAKSYELVLAAARNYWNAVLPMIGSPFERQLLRDALACILECLAATMDKKMMKAREDEERVQKSDEAEMGTADVSDDLPIVAALAPQKTYEECEDDLALQAAMYGVLFQVYADHGQWEEGLKSMDTAIASMPRTRHRLLLYKHRVMVKAKLGHNVSMDIQKFRNASEGQFSEMWHKLALFSKESLDQLSCYQNSIEALTMEENVWQRVDYLVEYAQWLMVNDYPLDDVLDVLDWSGDLLLNLKTSLADFGRPGTKQDRKKKKSAPPTSTLAASKDASKKDAKETAGGGTKKGAATAAEPAATTKRKKSGAAAESSDPRADGKDTGKQQGAPPSSDKASTVKEKSAKGEKSSQQKVKDGATAAGDINPEDYIPLEKHAEIGMAVQNEKLQMTDMGDMKQLEYLVRINTMAASMAGQGFNGFSDYCFLAYGCVIRMWQLFLTVAGPILKEQNRQAAAAATDGKATPKKDKDKGKKSDKETSAKERPRRKGPIDAMPSSVDEWASYDVPDELLAVASHPEMKRAAISELTMSKPSLLLHYLDELVHLLRDMGYHHLTLPVLAFEDLLTRSICRSHAYNTLVHLRSWEVCLELNMLEAVKFHEKIVNIFPVDTDEATSWVEMAVFKEKQHQVAEEERKIQASLQQMLEEEKLRLSRATTSQPLPSSLAIRRPKKEEHSSSPHMGAVLSAISLRDTWTKMAEILIRLGLYQPAREYLSASLTSAREFEDRQLQAKILFLLAKLSHHECQYLQAVKLAIEAQQSHEGDEMFWYQTSKLICDCQREDTSMKYHTRKASNTCADTLTVMKAVFRQRPYEVTKNGYILSNLEAMAACLKAEIHMEDMKMVLKPKYLLAISSCLAKWKECADQLYTFNFSREAVQMYKEIASIWMVLAREADDGSSIKRELLLEACDVLKDACDKAAAVNHGIVTSVPLPDVLKVSLPVQRELAHTLVAYSRVLLEVLENHIREEQEAYKREKEKDRVQKVMEAVIRQPSQLSEDEAKWREATRSAAPRSLACLSSVYQMASNIVSLRVESLYCIGRCLRLMALHSNEDAPDRWQVDEQVLLKLAALLGAGSDEEKADAASGSSAAPYAGTGSESRSHSSHGKLVNSALSLKRKEGDSVDFTSEATEVLGVALQLALGNSLLELARDVSYELVECFGAMDTGCSSQYLALYQSCDASVEMHKLLLTAFNDPTLSRKAAAARLLEKLSADSISTNLTASRLYHTLVGTIQTSQAWQHLAVLGNHVDLLRTLPATFTPVILQHSPDGRYLYGALLDRNEPAAGGGAKKPDKAKGGPSVPLFSKAKVVRVAVGRRTVDELIVSVEDHKFDVMQILLKHEYQLTLLKQREKMLEDLGESPSVLLDEMTIEEDEEELQQQFDAIVTRMEDYLKPFDDLLDFETRPWTATSSENKRGHDAQALPLMVVLLADKRLLQLPLEAMERFSTPAIQGLSRDVSLQMLYHRHHVDQLTPDELKAKQKAKAEFPSRIPGARDASKKQAKFIPLDRPVPTTCMAVDTNNFRYMVDPHNDQADWDEHSPMKVFEALTTRYSQQFTTRWLGISARDHQPSVGEWEIYISESSSFVFYGFEHLLSYVPPDKLVSLDVPDCSLCIMCDLAQTSRSFSRRSVSNVLKRQSTLSLESPLHTAMLLGMTGIRCIMGNQWHCNHAENAERVQNIMRDLLEKGRPSGQVARFLLTPSVRASTEAQEAAAAKEEKEAAAAPQNAGALQVPKGEEKLAADGAGEPPENADGSSAAAGGTEVDIAAERTSRNRKLFNMVCYGLPNLMVVQM